MSRSRILVAALAALALAAPAASARPLDLNNPHPRGPGHTVVMPERITDHRPDTAGNPSTGIADDEALSALVREQESTSGSPNRAVVVSSEDGTDTPWTLIVLGVAASALTAAGIAGLTRRTRTRARVAA